MSHMKIHLHKPKFLGRLIYLLLTMLSLGGLVYLIVSFSPTASFQINGQTIQIGILFFTLMFLFFAFLLKMLTNHFIHGISLGILSVGLLELKINNLFQNYLLALLLLFSIAIEFAFWPKRK